MTKITEIRGNDLNRILTKKKNKGKSESSED